MHINLSYFSNNLLILNYLFKTRSLQQINFLFFLFLGYFTKEATKYT